jgi:hypothetical protein
LNFRIFFDTIIKKGKDMLKMSVEPSLKARLDAIPRDDTVIKRGVKNTTPRPIIRDIDDGAPTKGMNKYDEKIKAAKVTLNEQLLPPEVENDDFQLPSFL